MNLQWYVRPDAAGGEEGPFERQALVDAVRQGARRRETQVRREDQGEWSTIGEHSAFRAGLAGWRPGAPEDDEIAGLPGRRYTRYEDVPYYKQQWFFWVMYFTLTPVALGLLIFGDVYYPKDGEVKVFSLANKVLAGLIAVTWMVRLITGGGR